MNFLSDWLKTHIVGSDKKYGPFFNSKGLKKAIDDSLGVCRRNRKSFLLHAAEIIQPISKGLRRLCPAGGIRGTSPFLNSFFSGFPSLQPEKPKPLFQGLQKHLGKKLSSLWKREDGRDFWKSPFSTRQTNTKPARRPRIFRYCIGEKADGIMILFAWVSRRPGAPPGGHTPICRALARTSSRCWRLL